MEYIDKVVVKNVILDESNKHLGFNWVYQPVYDRVEKMKPVDVIPIDWLIEKQIEWSELSKDTKNDMFEHLAMSIEGILMLWSQEDKKKWKVNA